MQAVVNSSAEPLLPPVSLADAFARALRNGAPASQLLAEVLPRLRAESRDGFLAYARAFLDAGLAAVVAALLQDAVARWPADDELAFWLGNAYRLCGALPQAEQAFRTLLQRQPADRQAAQALAYMLRDSGRLDAACSEMVRLCKAQGGGRDATLHSVEFLEGCQRFSLAAELCEQALAGSGAADPMLLFYAGQMDLLLGRFEAARQRLLAAIDGGLDVSAWSGIWLFLSRCQRYRDGAHPDLARFRAAAVDPKLSQGSRTAALFACGKASDDLGQHAEAAAAFRAANAAARQSQAWSAAEWEAFVEACLTTAPAPAMAPAQNALVPVFVVGLPRSGTTLVAELLGRHSQVCNRGESNWLPMLHQRLGWALHHRDAAAVRQAAATYLAHLRQDDAPARWYIDKNPLNFRYLDLVAAMLPGARIIHCVREPRDTALSIWSQWFAHADNAYSHDWSDIQRLAAGEKRLMAHWKQTLAVPILSLEYESLVRDPQRVLGQLGEFLGLPQQDVLHAPAKAGSAIMTSSVWQARQPLYGSSIGRWRDYAPFVPELAEAGWD